MNLPQNKWLVDTNVPITANLAVTPAAIGNELVDCVQACVETIERIVNKGGLVMDEGNEIFDEYRDNLSLSGQPGLGNVFMKWVHDHSWNADKVTQVRITKNEDSYDEFPDHVGLRNFDPSDRKFVAVANAHPEKPPIVQATFCRSQNLALSLRKAFISGLIKANTWCKGLNWFALRLSNPSDGTGRTRRSSPTDCCRRFIHDTI